MTGDGPDGFIQLHFQRAASVDRDSPIFVRSLAGKPGMFEVTFVRSDGIATRESKAIAFETRLSAAEGPTILRAVSNDPEALYAVGLFFLERFAKPNIECALPYLNAAAALGYVDALIELALIALFSPVRPKIS